MTIRRSRRNRLTKWEDRVSLGELIREYDRLRRILPEADRRVARLRMAINKAQEVEGPQLADLRASVESVRKNWDVTPTARVRTVAQAERMLKSKQNRQALAAARALLAMEGRNGDSR